MTIHSEQWSHIQGPFQGNFKNEFWKSLGGENKNQV